MLARLSTWAFYAVVFFLLGAWFGGVSPGLRSLLREGGAIAVAGFGQAQHWAMATISERPAPQPSAEPSPVDLLRAAREAFERGEVNESIALYRQQLARDPSDIDARGELGNVLSGAGRLKEAAEAYYEAALRLSRAGQGARAQALAAVVRRHDAALADRLAAELKMAKSGD
jgi:tetratricopeptide (TPR) repeat protein